MDCTLKLEVGHGCEVDYTRRTRLEPIAVYTNAYYLHLWNQVFIAIKTIKQNHVLSTELKHNLLIQELKLN